MSEIKVLIGCLLVVITSATVEATEPVYDEPVDTNQYNDQFVDRYGDDSASWSNGLFEHDGDGPILIPGPGVRDLPGESAAPEVTVVPEVSEIPKVSETPELPSTAEVPATHEIPAVPEVQSGLSVDDLQPSNTPANSELVAAISVEKLALLLVDEGKVKQSLERVSLFFVDGQIGTVNELSEKFKDIGTLCLFSTIGDSAALADSIGKNMVLQGSSKEQKPDSKGNTTLELKFSDGTLKLFCIKNNASDFTFGDLRTALNGIAEVRVLRE